MSDTLDELDSAEVAAGLNAVDGGKGWRGRNDWFDGIDGHITLTFEPSYRLHIEDARAVLTGLKAVEELAELKLSVAQLNDHFDGETAERERLEAVVASVGLPWPPRDVIAELVTWTEHLWGCHECDHEGYETAIAACDAAKAWLLKSPAPPVEQPNHDGPCVWCGEPTSCWAANPGLWPILLPWGEPLGVVKWHHSICVLERLHIAETVGREQPSGTGAVVQDFGDWQPQPDLDAELPKCRRCNALIYPESPEGGSE